MAGSHLGCLHDRKLFPIILVSSFVHAYYLVNRLSVQHPKDPAREEGARLESRFEQSIQFRELFASIHLPFNSGIMFTTARKAAKTEVAGALSANGVLRLPPQCKFREQTPYTKILMLS